MNNVEKKTTITMRKFVHIQLISFSASYWRLILIILDEEIQLLGEDKCLGVKLDHRSN